MVGLVLIVAGLGAVEVEGPGEHAIRAAALVADAERLAGEQRFEEALTAIRTARRLAPGDRAVTEAYRRVVRLVQGQPRRAEHLPDDATVQESLVRIEVRVALERVAMFIRHAEYDEALAACELAAARLRDSAHPRAQALRDRLAELRTQVERSRRETDLDARRRARQRCQELARDLVTSRERREQDVFSRRMSRVVSLMQRGHIRLALGQSRRLMSDYPSRPEAEGLFRRLLAKRHAEREYDLAQRKREFDEEFRDYIHRSLIPIGFDGRPVYPDDWLLHHPPSGEYTGEVKISRWKQNLLDRLGTRETILFDGVSAVEALELVARRAGIQLIIGTEVRTNDVPISLTVRDMRVDNIIDWITRMADTKWRIYKQVVYVGDNPEEEPVLRIYDVSQLTYSPPIFEGPDMTGIDLGADTGNLLGGGLFEGGPDDASALAPEDLVDLIRDTIAPEAWDKPDAGYGISVFQGSRLVVSASPFMHTLIQDFLRTRSRTYQNMVEVTARWLRVRDDFFEEIGLQWKNAAFLTAPSLGPSLGAYRQWDLASAASSVINRLPGNAANISPVLAGQGLTWQLAYLGATELSAIFTAVERKNRGRLLQGINLTTLSGVRANAMDATQIAFISGYDVGTGGGDGDAGGMGTTIGVVTVGRILDVTPFASADNKYVTLDIRPYFAAVEFGQETVSNVDPLAGVAPATIDLPLVRIFNAGTRVIVPDKGSVLLGGFKEDVEQHMATRVPFLGTLPFLGRLFGQRGQYSQRTQDYLLVRVQIILLEEEEAFQ